LALHKVRDLRYGENPHQRAAWFQVEGQRADVVVRQGKELSFTNLLDLDAAARIVAEFEEPAAVVVKHANPCGAAVGPTLAEAYVRAREADAVSAFGGIVGLNRALDDGVARQIVSTFIEAVIAPEVTEDAAAILAQKPNMRVVIAPGERATSPLDLRSIFAGVLVEDQDRVAEASAPWPPEPGTGIDLHVVTKRTPTAAEWVALRFAWRLIAHVKSNAIVFTTTDRTVAIGAGQTSRVDAVRLAALKAGDRSLAGSVAASDAFFPFRDGLDAVADAGATAVVQPGGSARDAEVVAAADERGLAMVFTGRRHFRH
jgi:phosphoribosylaminoimidazolecarboxamide formyltransferase/IMP cyclohydrolase